MTGNLVFNKSFSYYSPANKIILDRLEKTLGLDKKFDARRELAECLLNLLKGQFSSRPEIEDIRQEYYDAISDVLDKDSGPVPIGRGEINKNPIAGKVTSYPLPALLLEPLNSQSKKHVTSIKSLVLVAVILFSARKYINTLPLIRQSISNLVPSEILKLIPPQVTFDNLQTLLKSLAKIQEATGDAKDVLLAKQLSIIIKDIVNVRRVDVSEKTKISSGNLEEQKIVDLIETKIEKQGVGGKLKLSDRSVAKEQSKAWIRNNQRVTPNDYRIFLCSERRSLVNYLDQHMQSKT
jgi:hypothetical protein